MVLIELVGKIFYNFSESAKLTPQNTLVFVAFETNTSVTSPAAVGGIIGKALCNIGHVFINVVTPDDDIIYPGCCM